MSQTAIRTKPLYLAAKRVFDAAASAVALVVLSPVFLVVAVLILCEDGRPILYKQERVGRNGVPFQMYKFRTMRVDADDLLTPEQRREYQQEFKLEHDPRVTRIGRTLRLSSLDELPQLFNILKGDMSFVGPRPIIEREFDNYTEEEIREFQSLKPGLTGYWQAFARNDATYQSGERQTMEMYYVRNASVWLDVRILFKTVDAVVHKSGVK